MMLRLCLLLTAVLLGSACSSLIHQATGPGPIEEDPSDRTLGEILDDNSIETKAKVNVLKTDPRFEQAHINIASYSKRVLITGQVPDADMVELATQAVQHILTVRAIHNELEVGANSSLAVRANDSWISANVKYAFLSSEQVSSRTLDVKVEKGVVFLLGKVDRRTAKVATQLAADVSGVQRVTTLFDYID